ncbi:MAG: TIGR03905 family TSCPD domain-containing protein [Lachnospiraceae bacterium]|nr:TIGR03905 family TSCPD domain-containing protein [Lachnospiraceae bacterium]
MKYQPKGICATAIDVELDGDIIKSVKFTGGCDGNHKGICALVEGMPAAEAVRRLRGIRCGMRSTSCPDQLAVILEKLINQ